MDKKESRNKDKSLNRRDFLKVSAAGIGGAVLLGPAARVFGQADKKRISIATGGMGGVYFVLGGGIANVLTKYAGVEAAAEVTAASVDNCKLVGAQKSDLAFSMGDVGYDAFKGQGNFKSPLPLRMVCALYGNLMHLVTVDGKGITKVADLKGKRVSTGAPGSGTEVKAFRVLETAGINHNEDIKKDRLGAAESAGALKDGKIDAFFWDGGVPTAAVLDLASSPGIKAVLVSHGDLVPGMVQKYGPVYYPAVIPKKVYTGIEYDTSVAAVSNVLLCHADMDETQAYNIVKAVLEHLNELAAIHKEALNINLQAAAANKAIPYHKGAAKYFKEKGLSVPL